MTNNTIEKIFFALNIALASVRANNGAYTALEGEYLSALKNIQWDRYSVEELVEFEKNSTSLFKQIVRFCANILPATAHEDKVETAQAVMTCYFRGNESLPVFYRIANGFWDRKTENNLRRKIASYIAKLTENSILGELSLTEEIDDFYIYASEDGAVYINCQPDVKFGWILNIDAKVSGNVWNYDSEDYEWEDNQPYSEGYFFKEFEDAAAFTAILAKRASGEFGFSTEEGSTGFINAFELYNFIVDKKGEICKL